jgi:hypothetical protein
MLSAESCSDDPCVRIVPPSPDIRSLAAAAFARITRADPDGDLAGAIDTSAYADLLDAMRTPAARLGEVLGDPLVRISAPDLPTLTMDRDQFTGLHVDEWFQNRQTPRSARPNRIAFNLGREPRHFLFINLPVEAMMDSIGEGLSGNEGTAIGLRFMESFPSYPVARICINPGAAYIAPTESLVHDASSAGSTHVDIAGHLLGHFKLPTTSSNSEED